MADQVPATPPDTSSTLSTLSESARTQWRLTGELPETPDTPDTPDPTPLPDSSPDSPAEQAASTDAQAPPASEPGTPTTRKPNADTRKAELKAEIEGLLAQRNQIRAELEAERSARTAPAPQTPPAAPSPASAPPFPSYDEWIAADGTRQQSADPYIEYLDARAEAKATAVFEAKQREARAEEQARSRQQATETRIAASRARFDAAFAADPDLANSLDRRLTTATPYDLLPATATPNALNVIAQEIMLSEHGPALMVHLSSHPSEFDRLLQATSMDAIVRGMGRLEASLSSVAPTPKVVSSAPPPPVTVGARAGIVDEVESAGASGDFRAYLNAQNAREIGASASGSKR